MCRLISEKIANPSGSLCKSTHTLQNRQGFHIYQRGSSPVNNTFWGRLGKSPWLMNLEGRVGCWSILSGGLAVCVLMYSVSKFLRLWKGFPPSPWRKAGKSGVLLGSFFTINPQLHSFDKCKSFACHVYMVRDSGGETLRNQTRQREDGVRWKEKNQELLFLSILPLHLFTPQLPLQLTSFCNNTWQQTQSWHLI